MKNFIRRVMVALLGSAILTLGVSAFAVPANPHPQTFKQPDGTLIQGRLVGDEYFHWMETPAGDVFLFNKKTGLYEYALLAQADGIFSLVPSGIAVGSGVAPALMVQPGATKKFILYSLWKEARKAAEVARSEGAKMPVPNAPACTLRKVFFDPAAKTYLVEGSYAEVKHDVVSVEISYNQTDWYRAFALAGDFQMSLPHQPLAQGEHLVYARTLGMRGLSGACGPLSFAIGG